MKTLIVILIIASFLQTTILPIDLVLLVLICRAYIKSERANLYLAFAFGMLTAHLNLINLGFQTFVYLIVVWTTGLLSGSRLAGNPFLVVPVSFLFLSFSQLINSFINHQTMDFPKIIFTSILALPILFLLRLWEERFIVRKEIKLRV